MGNIGYYHVMLAKKFALAVAIAVVFPTMIYYGVSSISPRPRWDYTTNSGTNVNSPEWRTKEKRFEQTLFAVAVPLGLLAIIAGAYLSAQAAGSGLMFGGVFSVSDGYFNFWDDLPDNLKFGSLLIIFLILIFLAFLKLERAKS